MALTPRRRDTPEAPNVDQLRAAIDSEAAGDKVGFPDPAASPLGTDAEAGGSPPAAETVRQVYQAEIRSRSPQNARHRSALSIVLAFIVVIVISAGLSLWILL